MRNCLSITSAFSSCLEFADSLDLELSLLPHSRNVAAMIEQFLSIRQITRAFVYLIRENDKSLRPVALGKPHNHERAIAHIPGCIRQSFRQEFEWIVRLKVFARGPHRHVGVPKQRAIQGGPLLPYSSFIFTKGILDVGSDTGEMNVQLILRAAQSGIDGQTNAISRKRLVQRLVEVSSSFPGIGEVIRRIWPAKVGTLDAGDSSCRNKQELSAPSGIPQDRESPFHSAGQIDAQAGLGVVVLRLPRDTYIADNFPQRASRKVSLIRMDCGRREGQTGADAR